MLWCEFCSREINLSFLFLEKCENKKPGCIEWAASGQCSKTQPYMMKNCWKSCSFCGKRRRVKVEMA